MYRPLVMEQLQVDTDLDRARRATLDRRPRLTGSGRGHRSWWPRPRRSILRLALAGLAPSFGRRRACVDC